jgi:hypothetical protein
MKCGTEEGPRDGTINRKQRAGQLHVSRDVLDVLRKLILDAIRKDEAP